jgi:hypothetical protein
MGADPSYGGDTFQGRTLGTCSRREPPATGNLRTAAAKLRVADDERRQAKRLSLADKLTVEAKALADLKIEKAAAEGERRTVDADLGPVQYLATLAKPTR